MDDLKLYRCNRHTQMHFITTVGIWTKRGAAV